MFLYSHGHLDTVEWVISCEFEVIKRKVIDILDFALDGKYGERARCAFELHFERFHVIRVHVRVSERVHEFTGLEAADVRDHHGQQTVTRDVERHAQAKVASGRRE